MGGFSRVKNKLILYSTQATHPTGAYFGFYSKFYSPLDGMEVYHKVTPPALYQASLTIRLYLYPFILLGGERGIVGIK